MRRFRYGWGTFKMDWALGGPVPWSATEARESAVVHAGDSVADLRAFTLQVRAGQLPANPYLVIGQQSIADPGRAPAGCHTLWAYSHVPSRLSVPWEQVEQEFADRIEKRIEGLAPGFRGLIRARAVFSPQRLEAMDENPKIHSNGAGADVPARAVREGGRLQSCPDWGGRRRGLC